MDNSIKTDLSINDAGVGGCKSDVSRYFHPQNNTLTERFNFIYKIFSLNDPKISREIGIHKSTMSRYRRGIFIPTTVMKILIAKAISKLAEYPVDSAIIWGEDLFFEEWKNNKLNPGDKEE